ncbi:ThuA domain-containing protein [Parahaliea aestuarii]|uniref:ThuA domain-containing protein n=1 Tax=Parahaliea aestuarii TaxID=1852021 RepID=A0A5C9A2Q2_9GAMM|nr:ThuA domain-containing protein [Parahaliea aestuarii]TXS95038.1 ThuA domain-containing protein [Parahaliea aestuarii]
MSVIDYQSPLRALVSVKGHPYPRDAFFQVFEDMPGLSYTAVEQPASQVLMTPEHAADYDVIVLYDMPGIDFSTQPPQLVAPPVRFQQKFLDLLEQGKGVVFLHHAIAGWPLWPEYAEIVGGRFLYLPGELRGKPCEDSGYRHEVTYNAQVLAHHPVTLGVEQGFEITDELYLYQVFHDDVIPLLSSDFSFDRDHFYSATRAVSGEMYSREGWHPPSGSHLLGWVKHYRNSPIVYLQMGDAQAAYDNPAYRTLLDNALRWASSTAASEWARERHAARGNGGSTAGATV